MIEIESEMDFFGLVRNEEYVGLYMNLTAWNLLMSERYIGGGIPPEVIRLSISDSFPITRSGTHLIIIDYSLCDTTKIKHFSNPVILNYYRQVFVKADRTFDFQQEGLKRKIYEAISRCGINLYNKQTQEKKSTLRCASLRGVEFFPHGERGERGRSARWISSLGSV